MVLAHVLKPDRLLLFHRYTDTSQKVDKSLENFETRPIAIELKKRNFRLQNLHQF